MNLDALLAAEIDVQELSETAFEEIRGEVRKAARADVVRAAKALKSRRIRMGVVGIAAASVAGVATLALPAPHTGEPSAVNRRPVEVEYKTVAQIISAAAVAPSLGDPASAPYWKVVKSSPCVSTRSMKFPAGSRCTNTVWWGNGRPSVLLPNYPGIPGDSRPYQWPANTYDVDGNTLTWSEINVRAWTGAQIASLVAAQKPATEPAPWFDFAVATDLLADAPASDTIRKQLWRYLGTIPGVRMKGKAHDSIGRTGWRISMPEGPGDTPSVIIDPATGLVLEQENLAQPDSRTTFTSVGPTATAPRI